MLRALNKCVNRSYIRSFHSTIPLFAEKKVAKRPLYEIVVLDVETTNRSPENGKIIEFAASKIIDGHLVEQYMTLINPEQKLTSEIVDLTGISQELVAKGQNTKQALLKIAEFIGDTTLVAHNASFDLKYIAAHMSENSIPLMHQLVPFCDKDVPKQPRFEVKSTTPEENSVVVTHLCTLALSRRLYPDAPSHKLSEIATHLNIKKPANMHRAGSDVMVTSRLWAYIYEDVKNRLGFPPTLDVFEKLMEVKAKDVEKFFKNYSN
jgi:DNA polymerase-3 subunit epsilon